MNCQTKTHNECQGVICGLLVGTNICFVVHIQSTQNRHYVSIWTLFYQIIVCNDLAEIFLHKGILIKTYQICECMFLNDKFLNFQWPWLFWADEYFTLSKPSYYLLLHFKTFLPNRTLTTITNFKPYWPLTPKLWYLWSINTTTPTSSLQQPKNIFQH